MFEFEKPRIEIAEISENMNATMEDIGARRLHTVMENLLEDVSFEAGSDKELKEVVIDKAFVIGKLGTYSKDKDLKKLSLTIK